MKKYLFVLLAFVVAFTSSCTNDAITIKNAINFKVNPSTVIAPFTWEWNPGDLETFDTDYELRVRLLVYNSNGILEAEDVQYFNNYSVMMNSAISLPDGSYTAVAITDLVGKTSNAVSEYWTLNDYQRLADAHIDDAGYIGGKQKILGISHANVVVDGQVKNDVVINAQPAGVLLFVWFGNIHAFSDVSRLSLVTSKKTSECIFNADGTFSIASENHNGSYDWYIGYTDVKDYPEYSNIYGYYYVLPTTNMNLKFQYDTDSEKYNDLTPAMTINPKAGEEYMFVLDLRDEDYNNEITYDYGVVNDSRTERKGLELKNSRMKGDNLKVENNHKIYLKDIK